MSHTDIYTEALATHCGNIKDGRSRVTELNNRLRSPAVLAGAPDLALLLIIYDLGGRLLNHTKIQFLIVKRQVKITSTMKIFGR